MSESLLVRYMRIWSPMNEEWFMSFDLSFFIFFSSGRHFLPKETVYKKTSKQTIICIASQDAIIFSSIKLLWESKWEEIDFQIFKFMVTFSTTVNSCSAWNTSSRYGMFTKWRRLILSWHSNTFRKHFMWVIALINFTKLTGGCCTEFTTRKQ